VLLADDNAAMLDLVSKILANDYEIVGALHNGHAVLREYTRLRPDVVILSMSMGALSGIEVAQALRNSCHDAHIVLVTVEEESDFVTAAIVSGVNAYVSKFRLGTDLLLAIHAALVNELYVSPTLLYQPQ